MIFLLYTLAFVALATGAAAIYMALIKPFPVEWLYYHYFARKPIVWAIFIGTTIWVFWETSRTGIFPTWSIIPVFLMGFAVVLTYKMHQENAFQAVDFPELAEDATSLPLKDNTQLGIVEYEGVTKAYPLDYVIHHHIINDRFGERIVALTYCAMCRSIIPFDVTDIGPLFVGSFKNANMIVADRKTKTFFQQATFESIIGKLHPRSLTMLPFQILSWEEVKKLQPMPAVARVTAQDFREFQLPIPGIWKKIIASEATPGLPSSDRDKSFSSRTHVIGVIGKIANPQVVYLKDDLVKSGLVNNKELDIFFIAIGNAVNCFKNSVNGKSLNITITSNKTLSDSLSGTIWDIRGKYISGEIKAHLVPIAISDEYWFSWKRFHSTSKLIRIK
jgi:hypothetical protein